MSQLLTGLYRVNLETWNQIIDKSQYNNAIVFINDGNNNQIFVNGKYYKATGYVYNEQLNSISEGEKYINFNCNIITASKGINDIETIQNLFKDEIYIFNNEQYLVTNSILNKNGNYIITLDKSLNQDITLTPLTILIKSLNKRQIITTTQLDENYYQIDNNYYLISNCIDNGDGTFTSKLSTPWIGTPILTDTEKIIYSTYQINFQQKSFALGENSHAEGTNTYAYGQSSHAEGGNNNITYGRASHVEGWKNKIITGIYDDGVAAHAEGMNNIAEGRASHVEGKHNITIGENSHAEGKNNIAYGTHSHIEGSSEPNELYKITINSIENNKDIIITKNNNLNNNIYQINNHFYIFYNYKITENNTYTYNIYPNWQEQTIIEITTIDALKISGIAYGNNSHAEGNGVIAFGNNSHAEGWETRTLGVASHAEGIETIASGHLSHAEGGRSQAIGYISHAEGKNTKASGDNSHAEGEETQAIGENSHAEGSNIGSDGTITYNTGWIFIHQSNPTIIETDINLLTNPENKYSKIFISNNNQMFIFEGLTLNTTFTAKYNGLIFNIDKIYIKDDIQDYTKQIYGKFYHKKNIAFGYASHTEGTSIAIGENSHAEGLQTFTHGSNSHAEGEGTITYNTNEHTEGQYNIPIDKLSLHTIGIGANDNLRENAQLVLNDGKYYIKGIGGFTGKEKTQLELNNVLDIATLINKIGSNFLPTFDIQFTSPFSDNEITDRTDQYGNYIFNNSKIILKLNTTSQWIQNNKDDIEICLYKIKRNKWSLCDDKYMQNNDPFLIDNFYIKPVTLGSLIQLKGSHNQFEYPFNVYKILRRYIQFYNYTTNSLTEVLNTGSDLSKEYEKQNLNIGYLKSKENSKFITWDNRHVIFINGTNNSILNNKTNGFSARFQIRLRYKDIYSDPIEFKLHFGYNNRLICNGSLMNNFYKSNF